jgi:hypothetical protein
MVGNQSERSTREPFAGPDVEVVELPLLLRREQVLRLERLAHARGISLGQMIRHVLDTYLAGPGPG